MNKLHVLVFAGVIGATGLAATGLGFAQQRTALPDDAGRYAAVPLQNGVLRVDRQTGAVSHCLERSGGYACTLAADERKALEEEIARLSTENDALKRQAGLSTGLPPKNIDPQKDRQGAQKGTLNLPADEEMDQIFGFLERNWRRLRRLIEINSDPQKP